MIELLQYPFVVRALIMVLLLSVVAGFVGTCIVVRRQVFVAGGITHAAFGGIGIAYYMGLSVTAGAMFFASLTALAIDILSRRKSLRTDSAVAIFWSLGMALGIIFMFLTPGYTPNLMGFMFGDLLTVTTTDIYVVASIAAVAVITSVIFYRPILYTAFAPDFAKLSGWPVSFISSAIAVVSALAIVVAIKAVGIILVLSVFTIPPTVAALFVVQLNRMFAVSTLIAIVGSLIGFTISFVYNMPSGAMITVVLVVIFIITKTIKYLSNCQKCKV
ncbi:MAG: metal ABC transporter permease [Bacteroidales bacterium]|nr:metal ABC transporter permease [Bacteroidales bacterium]